MHGSFCFKCQGTDRQKTFLASERSKRGQEVLHSPALHSDEPKNQCVSMNVSSELATFFAAVSCFCPAVLILSSRGPQGSQGREGDPVNTIRPCFLKPCHINSIRYQRYMLEDSPLTTDLAACVHHKCTPYSTTYLQQRIHEQTQMLQGQRQLHSLQIVALNNDKEDGIAADGL